METSGSWMMRGYNCVRGGSHTLSAVVVVVVVVVVDDDDDIAVHVFGHRYHLDAVAHRKHRRRIRRMTSVTLQDTFAEICAPTWMT
jgi:hypothetical protein